MTGVQGIKFGAGRLRESDRLDVTTDIFETRREDSFLEWTFEEKSNAF